MQQEFIICDNYSDDNIYRQNPSPDIKYCYPTHILVIVCTEGHATFLINHQEFKMREDTFLTIPTGISFSFINRSHDFKVDIFAFTEKYFERTAQELIKFHFYKIIQEFPFQSIPHEKTAMAHRIHIYLRSIIHCKDNYFLEQIVKNYLNILLYEACNLMLTDVSDIYKTNIRSREVAGQFISLVQKHIYDSRRVEYYADLMNFTPKYLSAMIKDATGKNASSWIDEYTIMEAKTKLRNTSDTIQNISYDLGFATPSHFGKFFKEKTGMTPFEYRSEN